MKDDKRYAVERSVANEDAHSCFFAH
jgi:hypothetical protein